MVGAAREVWHGITLRVEELTELVDTSSQKRVIASGMGLEEPLKRCFRAEEDASRIGCRKDESKILPYPVAHSRLVTLLWR